MDAVGSGASGGGGDGVLVVGANEEISHLKTGKPTSTKRQSVDKSTGAGQQQRTRKLALPLCIWPK